MDRGNDEGDFEDIFDCAVDLNIRKSSDCGSSPIISSGVSSTVSKASPVLKRNDLVPAPSATEKTFHCPWKNCTKVYKMESYYLNHVFLHKLEEKNLQKPTKEEILQHVNGFVADICNEMSREPNVIEEKRRLLKEIVSSVDSEHYVILVESLSDLICSSLAKRTKLLPSSQYEEFQCFILTSLNDSETFSSLKLQLIDLLTLEKSSAYVGHVVYRLVVRLGEMVQSYIISKMKRLTVDEEVPAASVSMSEQEERAFKLHLRFFLKNYYLRAESVKNEVWEARSLCLRNRFVVNAEGEPVGRHDILNNCMWDNNELDISENALKFFKGIEMIIRSVCQSTGKYCLENVLEKLIDPFNSELLAAFHSLTTGYLGEKDTLSFLREMVQLFYSLSIRKEQQNLLQIEGEKSVLAKFSLRDNFKGRASKTAKHNRTQDLALQPPPAGAQVGNVCDADASDKEVSDQQPLQDESGPQPKGKKRKLSDNSKEQQIQKAKKTVKTVKKNTEPKVKSSTKKGKNIVKKKAETKVKSSRAKKK